MCDSFAEQNYYEHVKYVLSLFRSAEITETISLALYSVSHALETFSGFTRFLSTPNGQIFDEILALFHLHLYSANYDYRVQNYVFLANLNTYKA